MRHGRLPRLFLAVAVISSSVITGLAFVAPAPASATSTSTSTSTIPVQSTPEAVAVNPTTGMVYVGNSGSNSVSVIDEATNQVTATINLPHPDGFPGFGAIAVNPATDTIYAGTNTMVPVTFGIDGLTDTSTAFEAEVEVIDGATNQITSTITLPLDLSAQYGTYISDVFPHAMAVDPSTNTLYVATNGDQADDYVAEINGSTNQVTTTVDLPTDAVPQGVAVNSVTDRVYVTTTSGLWIVDPSTDTSSPSIGGDRGVAVDESTDTVYASDWSYTELDWLDAATNATGGLVAGGNLAGAEGVAVDADTGYAYVANDDNTLTVVNLTTGQITASFAVGSSPTGVAVDPVTGNIYVANSQSWNVSVIAIAPPSGVSAGGGVAGYSGQGGSPIYLSGTASDNYPSAPTTTWSVSANSGADGTCSFEDAAALSTTVTCTGPGTYTLTLTADDGLTVPVTSTAQLTVTPAPITVSGTGVIDQWTLTVSTPPFTLCADWGDPDTADTLTATIDWGDGTTSTPPVLGGGGSGSVCAKHQYTSAGTYTATVTVSNDLNPPVTASQSTQITVSPNTAPIPNAEGPYFGTEGTPVALDGTAVDTDGDTVTSQWSIGSQGYEDTGNGTCTIANPAELDTTVTCTDEGHYELILTVNDGVNPAVTSTSEVTISNAPITVGAITGLPAQSAALNSPVTATATFTDPGTVGGHTATINWGDGTTTKGTVTETVGSGTGSVSGSHSYAAAGTYTVTVSVSDQAECLTGFINTSPPQCIGPGALYPAVTGTNSAQVTVESTVVSPATLPAGTIGASYSSALSAAGGTAPYTWSVANGSLPAGLSLNAATGAITGTPQSAGNFSFTVGVEDANNAVTTATISITVDYGTVTVAVSTNATGTVPFGQSVTYTAAVTGAGTVPTGTVSFTIGSTTLCSGVPLTAGSASCTSSVAPVGTPDTVAATYSSTNPPFTASQSTQITIGPAVPPTASAGGPLYKGTEGTPVALEGTAGPAGDTLTSQWSWNGYYDSAHGTCTFANPAALDTTVTCTDEGGYELILTVTDLAGNTVTSTANLTISNAPITVGAITGLPAGGVAVNSPVTAAATFTDPGTVGAHTATINWGDGTTSNATVTETVGSGTGSVSGSHSYAALGTYTVTVSVSDKAECLPGPFIGTLCDPSSTLYPAVTGTNSAQVLVATMVVNPTTLPSGTVGDSYSSALNVGGGTAPYTWSVASGSLPAGLSLNAATGAITGTPLSAGTSSFTIGVEDSGANVVTTSTLSITVGQGTATVSVSTGPITSGTYGQSVTYTAAVTGGGATPTGTVSFTIGSTTLCNNVTLAAGSASCTSSAAPVGSPDTVTASYSGDGNYTASSGTKSLTVAMVVSPTTLSGGTVGVSYSSALSVAGGTAPYTWSVASGSLPAGLGLNSTTGAITGTPQRAGTSSFTIGVEDSHDNTVTTSTLSITVGKGTSTASVATSPTGSATFGQSVTYTAAVTGGGAAPAGTVSFDIGSTVLCNNVTVASGSAVCTSSAAPVGSPDTVTVSYSGDGNYTGSSGTKSLTVAMAVTPTTLSGGTVGVSYSAALSVAGGTSPYTWSVASGSLPAGLSLNAATGAITGTPQRAGTPSFTIGVEDSGDNVVTTPTLSITIGQGTARVAVSTNATGTVPFGQSVTYTAAVTGAGAVPTGTISFTVGSTTLCNNVTLAAGSASCTSSAAPVGGPDRVTATYSGDGNYTGSSGATPLTVAMVVSPTTLSGGTVGVSYSAALSVAGGTAPYTWSVASGSLPAGLSLDSGTGAITGTPLNAGTSSFTVRVEDSNDNMTTTSTLSITVGQGTATVSVSTSPTGSATSGQSVTYGAAVTGGGATPTGTVSFAIGSTALCANVTLHAGSASCTSSLAPVGSPDTVTVTYSGDGNYAGSSGTTHLAVGMAISPTTLSGGTVGVSYSSTFSVAGGTSPYTWSVASGSLPAGLSLNSATGAITGTPQSAGTSSFTIGVEDSNNNMTTTSTLSITVGQGTATVSVSANPTGPVPFGQSVTYTATVTGAGAPTGTVSFTIGSTTLCANVTLTAGSASCTSSAAPVGSPDTVTATYSGDGNYTGSSGTTPLTVSMVVSPTSLSDGTVGVAYSSALSVAGGAAPYTWSVASGSLPAGLSLNSGTGAITGTPQSVGTSSFTIGVEDATDNTVTTSDLSITVAQGTATVSVSTNPTGSATYGQSVTYTAAVTGGGATPTATVGFTIGSTTLCNNVTLAAGSASCTSSAAPVGSPDTVTVSYSGDDNYTGSSGTTPLTVSMVVSPTSLSGGTVGVPYSLALSVAGGSAPYTWSVAGGSLPAGLSLDSGTGAITGTPQTVGTSSFAIGVEDKNDNTVTTSTLSITVAQGTATVSVSTNPTGSATYGQSVTYTATVADGGATPTGTVSFTIGSTTLCNNVTLAAGSASCTSSAAPVGSPDTVTASYSGDDNYTASSGTTPLTVNMVVSPTSLSGGTVGISYSATLDVAGGTSPYTWSVASGALPAGLSLDSSTGAITGTPLSAGTPSFAIGVEDSNDNTVTTSTLSITVGQGTATLTPKVSHASTFLGQTVTYSATVTGGGATPSGTVSFVVGPTTLCTTGHLSGGVASCSSSAAPLGSDLVTATYSGDANYSSATGTTTLTTTANGYWLVGGDGGIFTFGQNNFYGSTHTMGLQHPVVGMTPTADHHGYWMVATDGGMFAFGDAGYHGSIPGLGIHPAGSGVAPELAAPIVAMVASPDGKGYLLVASDGGVFAFGDALFHGSCPGIGGCSGSVVAVVPDQGELGYWVVTSTGHVYAFGNAGSVAHGQPGTTPARVTDATASADGNGYLITDADGDVYAYGDAHFYGSRPSGISSANGIVGIVPTADGGGYWLMGSTGAVYSYGDAPSNFGSMAGKALNAPIVTAAGF